MRGGRSRRVARRRLETSYPRHPAPWCVQIHHVAILLRGRRRAMEEGFASARGARGGTAPIASSTSPSWHASKPSSSTRRAALSACDLACSLRLFVCEPRDLKINLRTIAWHSLPGARRRVHHPSTFTPLRQSRRPTRVDRTPPTLRRVLESNDEVDASQAPADRQGKEKH